MRTPVRTPSRPVGRGTTVTLAVAGLAAPAWVGAMTHVLAGRVIA
ncbi:hypothetical protein AB0D99_02015 [Streptomyces sp. NPDC047971]